MKHILTISVLLLLMALNAGICCLPLWAQAGVDHSCCRHSSGPQACQPQKLEFERAEHASISFTPAITADPVTASPSILAPEPVFEHNDSLPSRDRSPSVVLRV